MFSFSDCPDFFPPRFGHLGLRKCDKKFVRVLSVVSTHALKFVNSLAVTVLVLFL